MRYLLKTETTKIAGGTVKAALNGNELIVKLDSYSDLVVSFGERYENQHAVILKGDGTSSWGYTYDWLLNQIPNPAYYPVSSSVTNGIATFVISMH